MPTGEAGDMTTGKRFSALVLAAIALLVLVTSSAFLVHHADHDCAGEDCPICEQMALCAQNLMKTAAAPEAEAAVSANAFALCLALLCALMAVPATHNPVLLKVKLSN